MTNDQVVNSTPAKLTNKVVQGYCVAQISHTVEEI
uniref:Uncharacterized protein n=1 Tax=Anguilla anguilla TaxID=7936 RepID=A0A0E9SDF1_ANGAN